jgi:hypothetical protein
MANVSDALRECADVFEQRAQEYGDITSSFERAASVATKLCGEAISPADVVRVLIAVKLSRLSHQPTHADSMIDLSVYAQILRVLSSDEVSND